MNNAGESPKIALFIIDNAITNNDIVSFIRQHDKNIRLVIDSNSTGNQSNRISQFIHHLRNSGLRFSIFLTYCFFLYPVCLEIISFLRPLVTVKNISIRKACSERNIQFYKTDNINSRRTLEVIKRNDIDIIVTCLFDQILDKKLIDTVNKGCLNIHPGLLPECRGVFPEFHTAAQKCHAFGVTIHLIEDNKIDRGRILVRKIIEINGETSMVAIGRKLIKEGLAELENVLADFEPYLDKAKEQETGDYYSYPDRVDVKLLLKAGYRLL